jgi:hypothetical protein
VDFYPVRVGTEIRKYAHPAALRQAKAHQIALA